MIVIATAVKVTVKVVKEAVTNLVTPVAAVVRVVRLATYVPSYTFCDLILTIPSPAVASDTCLGMTMIHFHVPDWKSNIF